MKAPSGLHIRDVLIDDAGPWMWREADYWAWEHPKAGYHGIRDLILAHTKDRKVMVQAGGCMGMYPRLWADHFATVYTFEPDAVNFYCLVANCPSDRIIKCQAALSDRAQLCTLTPGPDFNAGYGAIKPDPSGAILAIPLDALALPVVDALQLDCEGCEDKVIEGAQKTILRCQPVICVEAPTEALRARLEVFGYREVGRTGTMPDVVFAVDRDSK